MAVLLVFVGLALSAGAATGATALATAAFCPGATTFPYKVRPAGRVCDQRPCRWPRQRWRGAWAHGVLVLERVVLLVKVAAVSDHRDDLAGPFLAEAIPGLPRGPCRHRNPGR